MSVLPSASSRSSPASSGAEGDPIAAHRPRRGRRWRRVALALLGLGVAYGVYVIAGLPSRASVRALARTNPQESSVMRQRAAEAERSGRKLRRVQGWVPLSQVSRNLVQAVVTAEDPNFFGHEGIDWEALRESVETDVRHRRFARGGSTITQQLAKNLFFTTHKSVTRKLREMVVAGWLEEDLSKRRILELYLNVIEWGDGVYGCAAAAQRYYGKSVGLLDQSESAGLAAMIPSPRRINPRVDPVRHARAQRRILRLMARVGAVRRSVSGLGQEPPPPPPEVTPESSPAPAGEPEELDLGQESGPEPAEPD